MAVAFLSLEIGALRVRPVRMDAREPSVLYSPVSVVQSNLKAMQRDDVGSCFKFLSPQFRQQVGPSPRFDEKVHVDTRYTPLVGSTGYEVLSALQVERAEAVEAAEDVRQLEARRARVKARMMDTRAAAEAAAAEDPLVAAEGRKGMEQGEARFSFEVPLEKKVAWWHDKYRPRKPKYFNRVHTGYEWNKYNQTHYDHDNPPPKMVQGYKFNIFYPDLIDRQRAPAYQLLPDPSGAKDTCVIRFRGGPPYEDLAFKIVNREWEHSHKRGFKCRFERGILQLYFNFKRVRYRR